MRRWTAFPLLALLVVACEDGTIIEPQASMGRGVAASEPIVVMSRNLYLGADIDILLDPSANLPDAIATALGQVLYTDFRARAAALAQEIHDVGPHLVGLQEVTAYAVFAGDITDPTTWVPVPVLGFPLAFLDALVDELDALGDTYVPVQYTQNLILPLPFEFNGASLIIVYSDGDAILAEQDVAATVTASTGDNYATQQTLTVGGFSFPNARGWGMVDAMVNGVPIRFANTHLEIQLFRSVQEAQARELVGILANSPRPVILVGDFNSAANHDAPAASKTRSYHTIRNAGYNDLWLRERGSVGGLTCCQVADLSNTVPDLDQRLDIVFVRWGKAGFGGQSRVEVIGEEVGDIFTHPLGYTLWPSDHAGVAAWLWPAPGRVVMR